jgi:D-alanine--poly(phosphoribitol) ligase subunit 1
VKDFIELIKDNAKSYPDRIAVIDGERKISYADFFNLVNSISHQLIVSNSKPKIAFDLKQGIEGYALIVAVLNVGGTYCPMNPNDPIDKKMHVINEFAPDFILVESVEINLELRSDKVITFSKFNTIEDISEINVDYNSEDIIYVIYTSGSTGIPKGVRVCRKALNKFLEWSISTYAANENDVWGQFSFLSFDLSIVDIFTCLCSGAILYTVSEDSKSLPSSVIDKAKITIWHSSPEVVRSMMIREKSKPADLKSLRLMSFCGAPLTRTYAEFLFAKSPNLIVFNTYGPTEGTLFCTWQSITSLNYENYCSYTVSLGKPIEGWNIYLQPINDSQEFEVIIYGEHIGRGYSREISDTGFGQISVEGKLQPSFRTGDIVYQENNHIYFDGRKDRQVKINGNRVELAGIEYHLRNHLGHDCVVIFHNNKLFCFVETEVTIEKNTIMEFLATKLLHYEIPRTYFPINDIPMTPNAKIDFENLKNLTEEWIN